VGTRTPDLYRVKVPFIGFATTYKTAGTAKVRGSRTRHIPLWVELWVGNNHEKQGLFSFRNWLKGALLISSTVKNVKDIRAAARIVVVD
jgi:hypothetical protein